MKQKKKTPGARYLFLESTKFGLYFFFKANVLAIESV